MRKPKPAKWNRDIAEAPEPEIAPAEGYKNDDMLKPRFDLIPADVLLELAELYAINLQKYPARNWEKGMHWGRVFRAMMTHAWKWWAGEEIDDESGAHHLTHVIWNAMTLLAYVLRDTGTDDRNPL